MHSWMVGAARAGDLWETNPVGDREKQDADSELSPQDDPAWGGVAFAVPAGRAASGGFQFTEHGGHGS